MIKKAKKNDEDPYLALLSYRSSPSTDGLPSPAERLFGRRIRTRLPSFKPARRNEEILSRLHQRKRHQKFHHDRTAKDLPKVDVGETVRIRQGNKKEWSTKCKVMAESKYPRSDIVQTSHGRCLRRNRKDILKTPEKYKVQLEVNDDDFNDVPPVVHAPVLEESSVVPSTTERDQEKIDTSKEHYVTRSGRISKVPSRFAPT